MKVVLVLLLVCLAIELHAQDKLLEMESGRWSIRVADPTQADAYYQGQRFALSGMVPILEWSGQKLDASLVDQRDPKAHDHLSGLADEFDIEGPVGYSGTPPGKNFLKIGVGVLHRKDDATYSFSRYYEVVKRPEIHVSRPDDRSIRFDEALSSEDGDPLYEMISEIRILDDMLSSRRTLKNTGTEVLRTEFYGHHFLKIGDTSIGPHHSLTWPARSIPGWLRDTGPSLRAHDRGLAFSASPQESYYYHSAEDADLPAGLPIILAEKNSGIALTIRSDQPLSRFAVWGTGRVICPEPFLTIELQPNESKTWSTTYSAKK